MRAAVRLAWLAVAVATGVAPRPALAQERVAVSGNGGKAALVFDWETPTTFSAEVFDGNLIVRFGRPFTADLDAAVSAMPSHFLDATIRPDMRTAVFALRRDQTFRTSQTGTRIVIELLDPSGQARAEPPRPAPPKPREARPAAVAAKPEPALPAGPQVRLGQSEQGTRLEIDWGRPVKAQRRDNGRNVTLVFDAPGRLDLGDLKDRALKLVEGIDSAAEKEGAALSLTLADRAQLRQTQDGNRHILDIEPLAEPKAAAAKPEPKAETKPAAPPPTATLPPPAAAPAGPAAAVPAAEPPVKLVPPPTPVPPNGPLAVAMQVGDGKVTLGFAWGQPVAAAAFRRGEQIWLVFDRPAKLDLARLQRAPGTIMSGASQLADEETTVLRLSAPSAINPALALDGTTWTVELRHQPMHPDKPVAVEPKPGPDGKTALSFAIEQPGKPVRLKDPEVGDRLIVVPAATPGQGVSGLREYAEFRVLPSAQGVAIEALADRVTVETGPASLILWAPGGLMLSSSSDAIFGAGAPASTGPRLGRDQPLFDFPAWARGGEADLMKNRHELNLALAKAPPEQRTAVRLDNARFYFAHLMPPDALGAIERIEADGDPEATDPTFRAMKGAALAMGRRGVEAEAVLSDPRLADNREVQLWRAMAAVHRGELVQAHQLFAAGGAPPHTYPAALRKEMGLRAIEAALAAKEPKVAATLADTVAGLIKDGPQKGQLDFLRGRILADLGKRGDAMKLWSDIVARRDLPAWPRAEMALIEAGLAAKTLKPAAAIERLEKLRYVWRGDDLERRVLELLGQLSIESGDNAAGLAIYRELATLFPDSVQARSATEAMSRAFARLFVEGGAEAMPPLKALALYDEYRELTPSGAKGDAVIRNLADRLASIDLLDRAAELLEDLVKNRLAGEAKAEAGARLAAIRLQNGQPAEAVAALDSTDLDTAPEPLKRARARARAQAMLALDKPIEALALIAQDDGDAADRLRQDIYWKQADWPNAAKAAMRRAEKLNPASDRPREKPSEEAARAVMNAAVAASLAGDARMLAVLRDRYGKAMEQTDMRSAFRLIANGSGTPGDLADVRQALETAQGFQQYLNSTSPAAGGGAPAAPAMPAPAKPVN